MHHVCFRSAVCYVSPHARLFQFSFAFFSPTADLIKGLADVGTPNNYVSWCYIYTAENPELNDATTSQLFRRNKWDPGINVHPVSCGRTGMSARSPKTNKDWRWECVIFTANYIFLGHEKCLRLISTVHLVDFNINHCHRPVQYWFIFILSF